MSDTPKICLVVVFNHKFDRNLERLRALYAGRFSRVVFLVPFYKGNDPDVIPVYESSQRFQGYFAQAREKIAPLAGEHFVFIADDLLLNPRLNESNLLASLRCSANGGYITELEPLTSITFHWPFLHMALKACRFNNFVNAEAELPSRAEAFERFARHGLTVTSYGWHNLEMGSGSLVWKLRSWLIAALFLYSAKGVRQVVYPLARGYSDLIVIPADRLEAFCHYCGVFAAMGIFVECAAPTAMVLALDSIRTEKDLSMEGVVALGEANRERLEHQHERKFDRLLESFPEDCLYYHPIKLSRWD